MFDKSKRIAIIRMVEVRGRRLLRAVTYSDDPGESSAELSRTFAR